MKLIVQIPCLNEESSIEKTIKDVPRIIDGISSVEILVLDDGSSDRTSEIAKKAGANYVFRSNNTKGLARTFMAGLDACMQFGADIIVNTDGDNQYNGKDIPRLITPILDGRADIVVGDREINSIEHFSSIKKILQKLGSWVVCKLSGTDIPDTTSGFRAYSKEAALRLNIISPYTYTLESIIQAGKKHLNITHIPIKSNPPVRKSRLFSSMPMYIKRQVVTIFRMYAMFQPLRVFFYLGIGLCTVGMFAIVRYLYFYFTGDGSGHIQSLIISSICVILGFMIFMIGIVADIISFNRQLIENTLFKVRKIEIKLNSWLGDDKELKK